MKVEIKVLSEVKETLYFEKLSNGLEVYLLPKNGFSRTYGVFSTRFGSIHNQFKNPNADEWIKVPDGVAHFLEHKMFDKHDCDVMESFSILGANCNAFTSFEQTSYLFSTVENVNDCTELLLDFVQNIELSEESVEKEKGIIAQEIEMYQDNPGWRLFFGAIENLFHNHPVKIDIAGTVPSINLIDKDILMKCYQHFYHPSNMTLFICGGFDPYELMTLIKKNQNSKFFVQSQRVLTHFDEEPNSIVHLNRKLKMDVIQQKCAFSYKIDTKSVVDVVCEQLKYEFLLHLLFSKTSKFTHDMIDQHLIIGGFTYDVYCNNNFAFFTLMCEPTNFEELKNSIISYLKSDFREIISEQSYSAYLNKRIGDYLSTYDSLEGISNEFMGYHFVQFDFFSMITQLRKIKYQDLEVLYSSLELDQLATYIIE